VMSVEAGERGTAGQGPCWLQSRQRDEHLLTAYSVAPGSTFQQPRSQIQNSRLRPR
jgi:hypothetical protein